MNSYIDNLKNLLNSVSENHRLTLVMGNESCDLDSAVCAIVYAYFLDWSNTRNNKSDINENALSKIYLPLLNIPKEDLPLRTEIIYLFKKFNINLDGNLFIEDVDTILSSKKYDLQLILVDHHILNDLNLISYVKYIFDHRPKDTSSWKYDESVQVKMDIVGSCTTLICSKILESDGGFEFLNENKEASSLLYETIILDTANFLPSADRAKPLDFQIAAKLEEILNIKDCKISRKERFTTLLAARTDYSSLSSKQLLRRDLKVVNGFPLPGLPLLVKDFLKRDDVELALEQFCLQYNTTTCLIIGLVVINDEVLRDLAVFSTEYCEFHKKVVDTLLEADSPPLELQKTSCGLKNCDHFQQINIKASRKQILPVIKKLFEQ